MEKDRPRCAYCGRDSHEVPLLALRYHEEAAWICSQHLPILIHTPPQAGERERASDHVADRAVVGDPHRGPHRTRG